MSERDEIERAARVAEDIARKWQVKARDYPYHGEPTGWSIAAAIRAIPPAETEEVSEAMIEAGMRCFDKRYHEDVGTDELIAAYLAMRAADKKGGA